MIRHSSDFSLGKHAVVMGLFLYHTIVSIILFWTPVIVFVVWL